MIGMNLIDLEFKAKEAADAARISSLQLRYREDPSLGVKARKRIFKPPKVKFSKSISSKYCKILNKAEPDCSNFENRRSHYQNCPKSHIINVFHYAAGTLANMNSFGKTLLYFKLSTEALLKFIKELLD